MNRIIILELVIIILILLLNQLGKPKNKYLLIMFIVKAINEQPTGEKVDVYLKSNHLMGWRKDRSLATEYTKEKADELVAKWKDPEYGYKNVRKIKA